MIQSSLSPLRASFGTALIQLARLWRREADKTLNCYGLSQATALPLVHLARLGGAVRQGVLADELGIEGPSLVRLIDQLEAEGFVERREDCSDRRAKLLHVTALGFEKVAELDHVLDAVRKRLLGTISDADLETTMRVLRTIEATAAAGDAARSERDAPHV